MKHVLSGFALKICESLETQVYWNVDYRKGPIYTTAAPFVSPESLVSMELVHALRHVAVAGGDWAYGHYIPLEEAKR
jgi:hypothetical protein